MEQRCLEVVCSTLWDTNDHFILEVSEIYISPSFVLTTLCYAHLLHQHGIFSDHSSWYTSPKCLFRDCFSSGNMTWCWPGDFTSSPSDSATAIPVGVKSASLASPGADRRQELTQETGKEDAQSQKLLASRRLIKHSQETPCFGVVPWKGCHLCSALSINMECVVNTLCNSWRCCWRNLHSGPGTES